MALNLETFQADDHVHLCLSDEENILLEAEVGFDDAGNYEEVISNDTDFTDEALSMVIRYLSGIPDEEITHERLEEVARCKQCKQRYSKDNPHNGCWICRHCSH